MFKWIKNIYNYLFNTKSESKKEILPLNLSEKELKKFALKEKERKEKSREYLRNYLREYLFPLYPTL